MLGGIMMKREDFIKIIRLRSVWKVDKRIGNYKLLNGRRLSDYISKLVETQMEIDNLGIRKNGDLCFCQGGGWNFDDRKFNDYVLHPAFEKNEICTYVEMERRINNLIREIVG